MRRLSTIVLLFFAASLCISAQKDNPEEITIIYYNTGGLFDTNDNKTAADDEYLPGSIKAWDRERYEEKVSAVAKNLAFSTGSKRPAVIGLAGIENKKVINDILSERRLRRADYNIYISDKPGTNIALLFNKDISGPGEMSNIIIDTTFIPDRDQDSYGIIYVKADIRGPGSCHFFLNYWPGMENRRMAPENYRMGAAIALRKKIDEILNFERNARIIIMGTFFDEPTQRSVYSVLNAGNKRRNISNRDLYNLYYDRHNIDGLGTTRINGMWQMWDQIILSSSLVNSSRDWYCDYASGGIFFPDEVEEDINRLGNTYNGDEYTGKTSANLPVFCTLKRKSNK